MRVYRGRKVRLKKVKASEGLEIINTMYNK